jgi:hypothetical protein
VRPSRAEQEASCTGEAVRSRRRGRILAPVPAVKG